MSQENLDFQPEGRLWLLVILVLVVFAGALVYFEGARPDLANYNQALSSRPGSRQTRLYTVFYNTGVFSPTNIRIHIGDSVKFQNDNNEPVRIASDQTGNLPDLSGFDSVGDIQPQAAFTYTFNKSGIFGYHNEYNKSERGAVIVRP